MYLVIIINKIYFINILINENQYKNATISSNFFYYGIFIYYRKLDYYKSIPRLNLLASLLIMLWTFLLLLLVLGS